MAEILAAFGDDSMGRLVPTSTLPRPVAEATQNRTRLESRAERLLSMTASKYRASINGFWCHNETWDDALNWDGKHDEVFLDVNVKLVDSNGTRLSEL